MQDDERPNPPGPYWSRGRVLLAGVILIAGLGPILAAAAYTWHVGFPQEPAPSGIKQFSRVWHWPGPAPPVGFDTDNFLIPADQVRRGGPPKDGIPALTDPQTVPVAKADFMLPKSRLVGITINGESRAYPIKILSWHECVNDVVGGVPVAVIYCPLCDSVSVVDRRLDGQTFEFGVSGLLFNSNVLLYDRTDHALWSQIGLKAVSGPNAGKALRHLGTWRLTRFELWTRDHPDSSIVSTATGHDRDYLNNPYAMYHSDNKLMFPVASRDDRLPVKASIVGIKSGNVARAYQIDLIIGSPDGKLLDRIGDGAVELIAEAGRDSVRVSAAPDDALVVYTYWFAWAAFHPDTELYGHSARGAPAAAATQPAP